MEDEYLFTVQEVGERMSVSTHTIHGWIQKHREELVGHTIKLPKGKLMYKLSFIKKVKELYMK